MASSTFRILVVDDHADSAALLARLLKIEGHIVQTAGSIAEATSFCESATFDLLISDIGLPDGTGYELMAKLHERYGIRGIALTGRDDVETSAAQGAGFESYLTKPVNFPDLYAAVARVPCGTSK